MRVAQITVSRSEHHSVSLQVGAWEVPVLQYEYSPETVTVEGFKNDPRRQYPDAGQEFQRLSLRYGIDMDTGNSKASMVYGQGAMGVMNIRNLIDAERKLEASEEVEQVETTTNVVENPPEDVKLAAHAGILTAPGGDPNAALATLLAESQAQNKALAEALASAMAQLNPPQPAAPGGKPTLSLPKANAA